MKKVCCPIALFALAFFALPLSAQVVTPQPSPAASITQTVGLTDVKIEYSRPAIRGRKIFGDLIPFGELWRTGANGATKITFSDSAKINGMQVAKGTYSIFSLPGATEWTIIINKNATANTAAYKQAEDVTRFMVKPMRLNDKVESFTIGIANVTGTSADVEICWENTKVAFPITMFTDEKVAASIKATMDGPSDGSLASAASYYLETGKDPKQALAWMDAALAKGGDKFFLLRTKSLIQEKLGDYAGAIATAKKSKELAQKAGNMDYVRMNDKSIMDWAKK